jgi:tetratricopeptide (TPR) repeat protein
MEASNPYSTGGGGTFFEQKIQANFVALFLMAAPFPIIGSGCYQISLQARRSGVQTDDMVVYFAEPDTAECKLLVQIKHKLKFVDSDQQTKDALLQAWVDFNKPEIFNPEADRIAFITGPLSQPLIDHVLPLFDFARKSKDAADFMDHFKQNAEEKRKKIAVIKTIIQEAIKREVTDDELWRFLKVLDVLDYDFDHPKGKAVTQILTQLRLHLVVADEAQDVWSQLCAMAGEFNMRGGAITRKTLPKELTRRFKPLAPALATWGIPMFNIDNFIGNQEYLGQIVHRFQDNMGKQILLPLIGLGGIGKTYLALNTISILKANYTCIVWFNAKSKELLEKQFLEFAQFQQIPLDESSATEAKIGRIKNWLNKQTKALLIFDDADSYAALTAFIPPVVGNAHILVTSIKEEVGWTNGINIGAMNQADACELLKREIGKVPLYEGNAEALEKLLDLLGGLPLAIAQAGAYMQSTDTPIDQYVTQYKAKRLAMLNDGTLAKARQAHEPVYITFKVSIDKVTEESIPAEKFLTYCAYLHPNNIRKDWFNRNFPDLSDPFPINEVIPILKQYSLIKSDIDVVNIHCVVQDVIREIMSVAQTHLTWILQTMDGLNSSFHYDRNDQSVLREDIFLIPHMLRVKDLALEHPDERTYQGQLGRLLYNLGVFYLDHQYDSQEAEHYLVLAEPLIRSAENVELLEKLKKHLLKAQTRNGKLDVQCVLEHDTAQQKDVDVLCILGNYYLRDQTNPHRLESATKYFSRALDCATRNNDEEKIAMACHYLGTTWKQQWLKKRNVVRNGQEKHYTPEWIQEREQEANDCFKKSLEYYNQALALKQTLYPNDSPEIVRTKRQIGVLYKETGNHRQAKKFLSQACSLMQEFYGDEVRIDVIDVVCDLAGACAALGELETATKYFQFGLTQLQKLGGDQGNRETKIKRALSEIDTRKKSDISRFLVPRQRARTGETEGSSTAPLDRKRRTRSPTMLEDSAAAPATVKVDSDMEDTAAGSSSDPAVTQLPPGPVIFSAPKLPVRQDQAEMARESGVKMAREDGAADDAESERAASVLEFRG